MSLILEALRRSEAERRRGQLPDLLAPGHVVRRRTRAGWIAPLAALVVGMVVAAAVARWWWASPAVIAPTAAPAVALPPSAPRIPDPLPPPALAAPAFTTAPAPASPAPAAPVATAAPQPAPAPERIDMPPVVPAVETPRNDVAMLGQSERAALPPLRISMHVFDEDASRRFVIVDGVRLREGDVLAPGLRLHSIERDGLHLEWQGRPLWLSR